MGEDVVGIADENKTYTGDAREDEGFVRRVVFRFRPQFQIGHRFKIRMRKRAIRLIGDTNKPRTVSERVERGCDQMEHVLAV